MKKIIANVLAIVLKVRRNDNLCCHNSWKSDNFMGQIQKRSHELNLKKKNAKIEQGDLKCCIIAKLEEQ